jgi:hypothetical protein
VIASLGDGFPRGMQSILPLGEALCTACRWFSEEQVLPVAPAQPRRRIPTRSAANRRPYRSPRTIVGRRPQLPRLAIASH